MTTAANKLDAYTKDGNGWLLVLRICNAIEAGEMVTLSNTEAMVIALLCTQHIATWKILHEAGVADAIAGEMQMETLDMMRTNIPSWLQRTKGAN